MPTGKGGKARTLLSEYRRKRDFKKTREPSGDKAAARKKGTLRFVIQKHAASHLHFDLRLECDGVMKSWAVPKGPSLDPGVKRLAMQVEDHPIDYNTFEGTIPQGEYGGGTVMLWDNGTYTPDKAEPGEDPESAVREGLRKGDLKISFHGKRLHGSFALVRMKFGDRSGSDKPQWLLIKHRDDYASSADVVADNMTSVTTGRTMDEIAGGKSKVWRSNRASSKDPPSKKTPAKKVAARKSARATSGATAAAMKTLEPMYATVGTDVPSGDWTFEPKYDGIRVLAFTTPDEVRLITRNGKDKSAQFPEIVKALEAIAKKTKHSLVLDGEIVALVGGKPARFQELQSRMHVQESAAIARHSTSTPACLILFDILLDEDEVLVREPWTARREALVKRIGKLTGDRVQITDSFPKRGAAMLEQARKKGWEGIIAKKMDSRYEPGNRSRAWLKLKIEFRQEFVIGGYTEPRNSREHFGALLLGYFDRDRFIYAGHTGGGFTRAGLSEMYKRLKPLEQKTSPFEETPKTNERPHWVKPKVVVEVKFSEWTADRRLRQPIFLGVRDDKDARDVGREGTSVQKKKAAKSARRVAAKSRSRKTVAASRKVASAKIGKPAAGKARGKKTSTASGGPAVAQLDEIESSGGDGVLSFGKRGKLSVSNLGKIYFPRERISKGDLMRYYASVADYILPTVADRPLVLKRFPSGIEGQSFYQQNAGDNVPEGVRVETIVSDTGEKQRRIVGGDLLTLLYTIQLGAVSVDPWHSRIGTLDFADYTIVDLDPGPRANFARVVQVAHWCKEVIDKYKLSAAIKTSGSTGLHIYIPLPPKTPTEAATLVAQVVATRVAELHPREATIERSVKARGGATVYVDYLQNIKGKTIAGAYCVRAKPGATVSTPLLWKELDEDLDPRDFTIETVPERVRKIGDVWAAAMKKKNSLKLLLER